MAQSFDYYASTQELHDRAFALYEEGWSHLLDSGAAGQRGALLAQQSMRHHLVDLECQLREMMYGVWDA